MRLPLSRAAIRSFEPGDVAVLPRVASDERIFRTVGDRFPHPYTAAHAQDWIAICRTAVPETQFCLEVDGELAGGVGLELQPDVGRYSAELGYWLSPAHWGKGIATEAATALTEWGFEELLLVRVFARVFEGNPASARVLEKAGFTLEGTMRKSAFKLGRHLDQLLYARICP